MCTIHEKTYMKRDTPIADLILHEEQWIGPFSSKTVAEEYIRDNTDAYMYLSHLDGWVDFVDLLGLEPGDTTKVYRVIDEKAV